MIHTTIDHTPRQPVTRKGSLTRSIGETATTGRLLQDVFEEVWGQPLLQRRPRAKPHELKGTPAFVRATQQTLPGQVTYKITTRKPPAPSP